MKIPIYDEYRALPTIDQFIINVCGHIWLWIALFLCGCSVQTPAPQLMPDSAWGFEEECPGEAVCVPLIEPTPTDEVLPPADDEAKAVVLPETRPDVHIYTTKGCTVCARARKELEAAGLKIIWFPDAPPWVREFPTFAWRTGDRWWYSYGFTTADEFLLKYVATLPKTKALTATPAETIGAILADGDFSLPVQRSITVSGLSLSTSGTLAGTVSSDGTVTTATFSQPPVANVGFGVRATISQIELNGDSVVAVAKAFGVTVRRKIQIQFMEE